MWRGDRGQGVDASFDLLKLLFKVELLLSQFLNFVLDDDLVFSLDVDLLVVFEKASLVLRLEVGEFVVDLLELSLVVRYSDLGAIDAVEPTLEDIDGVVEDLGEGAHCGLASAVGLGLTPNFPDDDGVEVPPQLVVSLLVQHFGQLLLGEERLLMAPMTLEHLQNLGQVVVVLFHQLSPSNQIKQVSYLMASCLFLLSCFSSFSFLKSLDDHKYKKRHMIKNAKTLFLVLVCIQLTLSTYQDFLLLSWNKTLLVPEEKLSEESKVLQSYFSEGSKKDCQAYLEFSYSTVNLSVADGSVSNYSKRIFLSLDFAPLSIEAHPELVTYYKTKNSTMKVSMNQVEAVEGSGRKTKKITSKQELQYEFQYRSAKELTITSSQITLEMVMEVQSSFAYFKDFWKAEFTLVVFYALLVGYLLFSLSQLDSLRDRDEVYRNYFVPLYTLHAVFFKMQIVIFYVDQFSQTFLFSINGWIIFSGIVFGILIVTALVVLGMLFFMSRLKGWQVGVHLLFLVAFIFFMNPIILLVLTAYNIASLSSIRVTPKHDEAVEHLRVGHVIFLVVLMHLLQIVLWLNPGPFVGSFEEVAFTPYQISVLDIILIDFNALITLKCVQQGVLSLVQWAKSKKEGESGEERPFKGIEIPTEKPKSSVHLQN